MLLHYTSRTIHAKTMIRSVTTLLTLLACPSLVAAERKLEINDGDRVLLIGDAFTKKGNSSKLESKLEGITLGKK